MSDRDTFGSSEVAVSISDTFGPQENRSHTDTFGPCLDTEYMRCLLEEVTPDRWAMCFPLELGELVIKGIAPIDGQLMLLSRTLARDLLDERAAHAATRAALTQAQGDLVQAAGLLTSATEEPQATEARDLLFRVVEMLKKVAQPAETQP